MTLQSCLTTKVSHRASEAPQFLSVTRVRVTVMKSAPSLSGSQMGGSGLDPMYLFLWNFWGGEGGGSLSHDMASMHIY